MVVHEDNERPMEVAVIKKPLLEQKSYVIVKNHVRELCSTTKNMSSTSSNEEKSSYSSENEDIITKKRSSDKKHKKLKVTSSTPNESHLTPNNRTEIDLKDIEELKTIYMKCKDVMKRIETRYGHLLDLDSEAGPSSVYKKRKLQTQSSSEDECQCNIKKKIVFDEEGRQTTVDMTVDKHICVKNMSNVRETRSKTIAIEYKDTEMVLPDCLQELRKILQDPNIEKTYRNSVLNKMRMLKQEYVNEIRFNRHIIIEKLKTNPDEILDFKGTNLSTIPGYP